tara:strand:+ start:3565 stop:5589 length:2025 start_codon:yes stop_codon:yes gene_type:complete
MAREIINVGTTPNDGLGDPIRTAFTKTNTNFSELFARSQATVPTTLVGAVGDVAGMTAYDQEYYYYCFQNYDGSSVIWREVPNAAIANVAIVSATGNVSSDTFFIGNGSQLTGVVAAAPVAVVNGTTNITAAASGNANVSVAGTGNVAVFTTAGLDITGIVSASGNVLGAAFVGAGTGLTGTAASLTAGTATLATSATTAGTVTTAAQGNITSVGDLTSVSVVGNTVGGNLISLGAISASGTISAGGNVAGVFIIGDGGFLSNVTAVSNVAVSQIQDGTTILRIDGSGGNIVMDVNGTANLMVVNPVGLELTGNANVTGNVNSANIYLTGRFIAVGNVTGGNITTGGLLVSTANVQGTNVNAGQQMSAVGNITGGNILTAGLITGGNISTTGNVNAVNVITSNSVINAQISTAGNVTSANLITSGLVSAVGNIRGGNVVAVGIFTGPTANIAGNVNAANVNATTLSATGNVNAVNSYLTGRFLAIGNVTGGNVTTAGLLVTTGNVQGGNVISTGTVSASGNINGGNLRTSGLISSAGTVTGTSFVGIATSARYADLAENYTADAEYAPGTVLEFGGDAEVTIASDESKRVAGIVSTQPAHLMNSHLTGEHVVALALIGRVPCKVRGTINKGDMLISGGDGYARAKETPVMGTVIGKALEASAGDNIIEVVVGRS